MTIALVAVAVVAVVVIALLARAGARSRSRATNLARRVEAAEAARIRAEAALEECNDARVSAEKALKEVTARAGEPDARDGDGAPGDGQEEVAEESSSTPPGAAASPTPIPTPTLAPAPAEPGAQGADQLSVDPGAPGGPVVPADPEPTAAGVAPSESQATAAALPAGVAPPGPLPTPAAAPPTPAASPAAPAPPVVGRDVVLQALWALDVLDRARAARLDATMSTAPPAPPTADLAAALADEVGRLREETGTPGSLRVDLDPVPTGASAVVALRALQSLLGVLARHAQGYDLLVHGFAGRLLAVLVCDDFDGPDSVADDTAELLAVLEPLDGRLELDRDEAGRLRARLSLPAVTATS